MVMIMMVMVVRIGLFLNLPTDMEKVIDGTWQLKRTVGVIPINLVSFVQKALEKRMIKIPYRDHKSLRATTTPTLFF